MHLRPTNLCSRIVLACVTKLCSSFLNHVHVIIRDSSGKKMTLSDTGSIVALVQNAMPVWDNSKMDDPTRPVCTYQSFFQKPDFDLPVPTAPTASPHPTLSKPWAMDRNRPILVDLCPKSGDETWRKTLLYNLRLRDSLFHIVQFAARFCFPTNRAAFSYLTEKPIRCQQEVCFG